MKPNYTFLGGDATAEAAARTAGKVNLLLFGTEDPEAAIKGARHNEIVSTPPLYTSREEVYAWDGCQGCWNYHLPDGSIVEESRELDDEGCTFTNWYHHPKPAPRPHKTWHGDFEEPHFCVACEKEHGEDCCGHCAVWKQKVHAESERREANQRMTEGVLVKLPAKPAEKIREIRL